MQTLTVSFVGAKQFRVGSFCNDFTMSPGA